MQDDGIQGIPFLSYTDESLNGNLSARVSLMISMLFWMLMLYTIFVDSILNAHSNLDVVAYLVVSRLFHSMLLRLLPICTLTSIFCCYGLMLLMFKPCLWLIFCSMLSKSMLSTFLLQSLCLMLMFFFISVFLGML